VSLENAFVELVGNIEVVVIPVLEGAYQLIVEESWEFIRAGFVFVDDTQIIEEVLTDELRDGETQIDIELPE
jgi:hypothetical protein